MCQVYFIHTFNVNLQFAEMPVDKTFLLVEQGLIPLFDLLQKYKQPANFFFTGYSSLYLQQKYPELVREVQKKIGEGLIELGTYTYAHPVLSLIPYEDVERQIRKGMECDEKVWGIKCQGMLLPEVAWDVCLPKVMAELGLEWVIIYRELIHELAEKRLYPGMVKVKGIADTQTKAVLANRKIGKLLLEYLTGVAPWEKVREEIERFIEEASNALGPDEPPPLLCIKQDAEVLYAASVESSKGQGTCWGDRLTSLEALPRFARYLEFITSHPGIQVTTAKSYIDSFSGVIGEKAFYAENASGHAGFDVWLKGEGRERLNVLTEDARSWIITASLIIRAEQGKGADVRSALELLEGAWEQLLLAENSDGRAFIPHPSRKLFVATAAFKAMKLAQAAIQALK
ncbi:Glycosyl hydrolase family 57 [Thermanaeromonas toyohensis ToBE]|uniref:Glycosyl hydrolase family 57 n=1 Tax=Thermanaeromonas toyohensis ToBE TaxID=698762 RepID=A0A1W1VVN0_9FIRM|nr:Glycosyl hydrolase family 57 [Thermanaeromonas toyohensis ToBE]